MSTVRPRSGFLSMRGGFAQVLVIVLLCAPVGCRLPGMDGPVSRSLAASRQLSQQAVAAEEQGQSDQAEALLSKAVRTCPSNSDARRSYAEALWRRGKSQEALAQLQAAERQTPEDPTLLVRMAEMRLALGETRAATEYARKAIALDPRLSSAWAVRARIERSAGQQTEALADYHRALSCQGDDRSVQWELAETYRELNQPEKCLATLHVLADSYPPGDEPQSVLCAEGKALLALGRADDAVESLATACTRDKPTADILYWLAESQMLAGRVPEAIAAAQRAVELDPTHQPSRRLLDRADTVQPAAAVMPP